MSKSYLYAAAVQGIQDFIFKTNDLKHIVGASELVEQVCTSAFDEFAGNGESVVRAAGGIKHIFHDPEACKNAYRNFPRKIMVMAPGVTVSQAVVAFDANEADSFAAAVDKAERQLKVRRNMPEKSVLSGLMGIKRANNTGLPVTGDGFLDDATCAKINAGSTLQDLSRKSFGFTPRKPAYDISQITGGNDWIAIIHADGNGLGQVVRKVGHQKEDFKAFSEKLDQATREAANEAYTAVKGRFDENGIIPIRPVVLSGDDMTVIIRGDLAIEYAKAFMAAFESRTHELLKGILTGRHVFADGKDRLTACAGIAFIKSSYPFYYGYQLAEDLCAQAKKDTKALAGEDCLPNSCLMFHKVQDSFISDYKDIVLRELSVPKENPRENEEKVTPLFKAGPYYLQEIPKKHTVGELEMLSGRLDSESGNGVKSGVRNWISLRLKSKHIAAQRKARMLAIFSKDDAETVERLTEEIRGGDADTCIAYDVLAYHTIKNQITR